MIYSTRTSFIIAGLVCVLLLMGANMLPAKVAIENTSGDIFGSSQPVGQDSIPQDQDDLITLEQVKDSLKLYQQHNNTLGIARTHHRLGDLHQQRNNPSSAVAHYLMASDQYKEANKLGRVVEVYHRVATVYRQHDHFERALKYASRAQELANQIKDDSLIAMSAYQLGRVYEEVGKHLRAQKSYKVALDLFQRYDKSAELSDMYHHMAEVQERMGDLNETLDLHQKALSIRADINDSSRMAKSYFELGNLFAAKDDVAQAINYHKKAADIRDQLGHSFEKAQNYIKIGELSSDQGNLNAAANYANRALHIANSFNALELKVEALKLALNTHIRLGNMDRAASLQDSLEELQDSLEVLKEEQQQRNLTFHLRTKEKVDSLKQLQKAQEDQQAQLEREHFLLIIAIIVALALVIILLLLYNRYRYRRHQENLLLNKNEELENLNHRLEALNEEKNDIMQAVTHDLKNPLAGIIGLADIILSEADTMSREEVMDFMKQIENSAQKMNDMIRKLLDIRTIELGGHDMEIRPTNITELVEEVIKNNAQRAKEKDIDINSNIADAPEMVMGDHTAIQRVLDNLVSNAIKYTPKGKRIKLNLLQDNGDMRVEVTDEGPGIKEEERQKLFKKFSRLSNKPTDGEDSTGLGLYVAKQLTEEMNGKIGCDSELGEGSTFYLTLPRTTQN